MLLLVAAGIGGCQPAAPSMHATQPAARIQVIKEFWPDGALKSCKQMLHEPDGSLVQDGPYTTWFRSGVKQYEANYVKGKLDGKVTAWHENGQVWTTEEYVNGLRHGTRTAWDQEGHRVQEEHYYEGKPDGTWTIWKPDGTVEWQGRFDKGKPVS